MVRIPDIRTIYHMHVGSSYALLGLALVTQVISYPLLQEVQPENFEAFHANYMLRISIVAGPLMALQLLTGLRMVMVIGDFDLHALLRADLIMILSIWAVTLLFALPAHISLQQNGLSDLAYRTIYSVNWFRVLAWLLTSLISSKMMKYFYGYDPQA